MTIGKVFLLEGIGNGLVLAAKLAVAVATGSAAILGDALHSFADLANNVLAVIVVHISKAPPDREHPYGHRKFEALAVFGMATFLTVVAIELLQRALGRAGAPIADSRWGLLTLIVVLLFNMIMTVWEGYWARRLNSDLLRADQRHTLSDVLTTLVVIAGWQLAAHGFAWLDSVLALLISGLIFYLAVDLYRRTIPSLVDRAATNPTDLIEAVRAIPEVQRVVRVRSRSSGAGVAADIVVGVDGDLSTTDSHLIADTIEEALARKLGIRDVTVHIEPHDTGEGQ
ncbi:MAG: cation diffusion facilitator family transporter [Acidobacteriota bacterium]